MKDICLTTTPKMTIHLDAFRFAHDLLDADVVIGISTSVTPNNKRTVEVVTINNDLLPQGDHVPGWQEVLSDKLEMLISTTEYKDGKVELDWKGIVNWIENSIHAELKKLGVKV